MRAPKTGFIEIGGINVYYELMGEGPSLVFIHGGGLDSRMWDGQFGALAEHYRVIRYDIPGFGKSEFPTSAFSNIEILHGLLSALDVDQAHILGLSLGGRIAIDFALEYPEQVTSLILVAPGLGGYSWSTEELHRIQAIRSVAEEEGALQAAEKWLEDPYLIPAMENLACREKVRQLVIDNAQFWVRLYPEQAPRRPAMESLSDIHASTLVIVGDRDVKDIHAIVDVLEAGIMGVRKVVIEGAGHIVNMENSEQFNRTVLDFLMELDP